MAEYKTPTQIGDQYLLLVKGLKPSINTAQTDSDWWVRSRAVGGVVAGVYADQKKISNDAFPQSSRREAIERHLELYFDEGFTQPTQSVGEVGVTGTIGSTVPAGTEFLYDPNGNTYQAEEAVTLTGISGVVPVKSVGTGQAQNLLEGAQLTISSPPAGIQSLAIVVNKDISDGRDEETEAQAVERILRQIRTPLAGGKVSDYEAFALAADPAVVSANVIRYPFGLGTVGVVITAGTTDIDAALDNGQPVVQVPSNELIEIVQAYIETQNPITDCATVLEPIEVPINVTGYVKYQIGNGATILSGQTLTQDQLVEREVKRAIYKTPPGGRKLGTSGYVVASEIEEVMDSNLSASPYQVGVKAQILIDRKIEDLSVTGFNRLLLGNEIPIPGVITILEM